MRSLVKRTLVLFSIAGAFAAADSLDRKSRSDRNPAGRPIASLRAIR